MLPSQEQRQENFGENNRQQTPFTEDLTRLSILLAEDNFINQKVAARMLEKQGHQVYVANNGQEALDALKQQHFDIVLMDIQMPEMDGLEATATIRRAEAATGSHMPVLAVTAHAMAGDREKCLAAGMDGYVSKPVNSELLINTIREILSQRRPESA